jgi:alpha-glucuronidase
MMRYRLHLAAALLAFTVPAGAETGYDLWLRFAPVSEQRAEEYRSSAAAVIATGSSPTVAIAASELVNGIASMTGAAPAKVADIDRDGTVLIGTPGDSAVIRELDLPLESVGDEGFIIRQADVDGDRVIAIAANADVGLLYGVFELLRRMQMELPVAEMNVVSAPRIKLRLLNHWDNLNGFVERGYAGASIWDWHRLPDYADPRYTDYARANASLGINGAVLNNVNANASILRPTYVEKVAAIADVLRPYGMKVYLSARFSAPVEIGGLDTSDPADERVRDWWRDKVDEIYEQIPDFGGFLVKANSEGQPGPQDFGRSHADGANMLADALARHGGVVMWRAFVYSAENPDDRVRQAYDEFVPLDGTFRPNVMVQVKNGPLDFQPREPFHPLFGSMPKTPLVMELQVTKEYLGFASHLAYLGTLWEEVLQSDTYAQGAGSTVAKVIDGSLEGHGLSGIAGVSNIGADINWSGSIFAQANWYAYGRLAWNPDASARALAEEWLRQTFNNDPAFLEPVVEMMMASREAVVDYMTPLGLTHLMATGHHYGPAPWVDDLGRADWNPFYYHGADSEGIGFDRTTSGSGATQQYHEPLAGRFERATTTPDNLLLWFHRLPWDYRLASGQTLWEALVEHYDRGVDSVGDFRKAWAGLRQFVDARRYEEIESFLAIQEKEARWWRNACIAYFQSVSGLDLPDEVDPPPHSVDFYRAIEFPHLEGY